MTNKKPFCNTTAKNKYIITEKDSEILRCLAGKVAELAARHIEAEKRKLWTLHNKLEKTRPVIYCDPENGWHEIITSDSYECETQIGRDWEFRLRKEIFWGEHIKDDKVIEPYFNINHVYEDTGWGIPIEIIRSDTPGSYTWIPHLTDYRDMDKLRFPEIIVNYEATNFLYEQAQKSFGDLLDVRIRSYWWWSLGMGEILIYLRGIEEMMMDMIENPGDLHRLMKFLSDAYMAKLDFLEENGLLSLNTDFYVGSGGFGYTDELPSSLVCRPSSVVSRPSSVVRTQDMWGFAESQETAIISPDMFEEFIFPYQLPLLERFGLNCYGCCEPLDKRWHVVKKFPRLRRISVSPWADLRAMAENLADKYVYSLKANPTPLASSQLDEERVRKYLRESLQIAKDCRVEVILKDTHTIGKNPENVVRWTRIAMEEVGEI